jgi:hypothetical protein
MTPEDESAVRELLELHGHFSDAGAFDRFGELFTEDVRYDVTDLGAGVLEGLAEVVAASRALGERNPLGHHVTNVVLREVSPDEIGAWSKGIGVRPEGVGSLVYLDRVVRTPAGWRIAEREVRLRRQPLAPYRLP